MAAAATAQDAVLAGIVTATNTTLADAATTLANTVTILADLNTAPSTSQLGNLVQAMALQMTAMQQSINVILASTAMYNGDVSLTTQAELDFFTGKIAQLGIINGNLVINTTGFTAAQMTQLNAITSNITATIGTGNFTLTQAAAGLNLSKLTSVKGTYIQSGSIGEIPALASVGGSFILNYKGVYSNSVLTSVGGDLGLEMYTDPSDNSKRTLGVNFPNAVVGGFLNPDPASSIVAGVYTPLAAGVACVYDFVPSFIAGGRFLSLHTDLAATIKIVSKSFKGNTTINSGTTVCAIDLSMITGNSTAAQALNITAAAGSTVDLSNFASGTVSDAKTQNITTVGIDVLDVPKFVEGNITSDATVVSLAKYTGVSIATLSLSAVKTLTLGAISAPIGLDAYTTLKTATITGAKAAGTLTNAAAAGVVLETLTVNGILGTVSLSNAPALKTVTTGGTINQFVLDNCDVVTATGLTLGHAYIAGSVGSDLVITNNLLLTTVKSSSDMLRTLTIVNNAALVNLDLSSYTSVLFGGSISLNIAGNALKGTYSNAVPAGVLPYVETTLTGSALTTLKPMIAAWKAATTATVPTSTATLTFSFNLDAVKYSTGSAGATPLGGAGNKLALDASHVNGLFPGFMFGSGALSGGGPAAYTDFLAIVQ
jgi:hypothetical protein